MWSRTYLLTLFATFAFWFNVDSLLLVLPLYMRDAGFEPGAIGLTFGAAAPMAILARVLYGRTIDRRGGWTFFVVGAATWAATSSLMAMTTSLVLLLLLRMMQGLGLGVFTTSSLAYVAYTVPDQSRDRALGWWGAASPTMAALGPVIAALILQRLGFTAAFVAAGLSGLLATVAVVLLPRSVKEPEEEHDELGAPTKPYVAAALLPGLFGGATGFAFGAFAAFAPILASELRLSNLGLYLSLSALGTLLARFVAGPLSEKKGRQWVILPGLLFATLAMSFIGFVTDPYLALAIPFFFGLGTGSAVPGLIAWAVDRAGESERATAGSTFFAFFEVGLFTGAPVLGVFIQAYGFAGFTAVATVLGIACVGYILALYRNVEGQEAT